VIGNYLIGKNLEEEVISRQLPEGTEIIHKNLRSRFSGLDSKQAPPEYKHEALLLDAFCLVLGCLSSSNSVQKLSSTLWEKTLHFLY
jgi:hypothetical protein